MARPARAGRVNAAFRCLDSRGSIARTGSGAGKIMDQAEGQDQ